jgi:CRP/FNR family cyclic AMP-dependent transcriptional regulator
VADAGHVTDADVVEALAVSFLGKRSSEVVTRLLAAGDCADYPAGTTIYREGSAPKALLVVHGLLRVYMTSPQGLQVTLRYARDRDVLRRGRVRPVVEPDRADDKATDTRRPTAKD